MQRKRLKHVFLCSHVRQEALHERDNAEVQQHSHHKNKGERYGPWPMHMEISQNLDDAPLHPSMGHENHNGIPAKIRHQRDFPYRFRQEQHSKSSKKSAQVYAPYREPITVAHVADGIRRRIKGKQDRHSKAQKGEWNIPAVKSIRCQKFSIAV